MFNFKKTVAFLFFIFLTSCGYTPVLETQKTIGINNLSFEGDRKLNNHIFSKLKKFTKGDNNSENFNIIITSKYTKTVANKDKKGNPKNFNLNAKVELKISKINKKQKVENFEKNMSLASQSKKFNEKELENKYIRDLSIIIAEDIIFYLKTQ